MCHPHVSWIDQKSSFTKKLVQLLRLVKSEQTAVRVKSEQNFSLESADVYCEALHHSFPLYHPSKRCEIKQLATALI